MAYQLQASNIHQHYQPGCHYALILSAGGVLVCCPHLSHSPCTSLIWANQQLVGLTNENPGVAVAGQITLGMPVLAVAVAWYARKHVL